jgi:hypothetical protein
LVNTGILCNERNVLRAPVKVNSVTLTDSVAPPQYFFETDGPASTIAHDANATNSAANNTTVTVSHTTGAGLTDSIIIAGIAISPKAASRPTVTATYDGNAMTQIGKTGGYTGEEMSVMFYYLSPTAGAKNVIFTVSGTNRDLVAGTTTFEGVNQENPIGSFTRTSGTGTAVTMDVGTLSGDWVIDCVSAAGNGVNISAWGANQTESWKDDDIGGEDAVGGASYETATGTSVTMSCTLAASDDWHIGAVPLKPAGSLPRLYAIGIEDGAVNAYKVSMDSADFGTLLNTKTWVGKTTQPMGRAAEWTSGGATVWVQPLGDNILLDSLTAIATGTGNDTWSGGTDAYARHLLVVKEQLYRLAGDNEINILPRNTDPETESGWTGNHYLGDAGRKVTDLAQVAGLAECPKEDGLWEFDGVSSATNVLPELGLAERNGQGLSYGRGGFFVPGVGDLYWTRTGEPIGPESHDDTHVANDPSIGSSEYFKHGRWMGTASYNGHFYGLYVNSAGTSALIVWGYPIDQRWRFHALGSVTADFDDFHGVYVSETSEFSATEVRPCLWFANGNNLSYIWLDKNGAPMLRRGDVDVATAATATSGRIDFGYPRVLKQLHYISGWGEDTVSSNTLTCRVYRDGGTVETVGSAIAADGYFDEYWTQDTNDTCRSLLFSAVWAASGDTTDLNGPHYRDIQIHAVLQPAVTRVWEFLVVAEDKGPRTAKVIRANWEGYIGDLLKFELPDGDSFNGVASPLEMLRPDEVRDLFNQDPPSYVFRATVREMPAS